MTKISALLLALILLFSTSVEASWTVIDSACASDFGGSNDATTAAIDTTGADLIVGFAGHFIGFTHVVSDSASNTVVPLTYRNDGTLEYAIWYIESPITSGTHTFTSTTDSGPASEASICAMALSGSHATAFDVENGGNNASSTTIQTGSVTPSTDGQIIITGGFTGVSDDWAASPLDSGFTLQDRSGNTFNEIAIGYLIQGTAGAVNPTWTADSSANTNIVAIATFKVAVSGASASRRVIVIE